MLFNHRGKDIFSLWNAKALYIPEQGFYNTFLEKAGAGCYMYLNPPETQMDKEIVKELYSLIKSREKDFTGLARQIWEKPELGFEEKFACARQLELLKELGFSTESPYAGVETAYKAVKGSKKPVFCFAAEYDALPELGHGCGHNLICAAAIAAGWALASKLEEKGIEGTVAVIGTPGEESKGGKVIMLKNHALDGVDAVMMVHPSWRTTPDTGSTAIRRFDVNFSGKSAHAAAAPELGLNALDAVVMLFTGINAWRQQLPEASRIHGVVSNGGNLPNIIPSSASCRFFLRSPDDNVLDKMEARFMDIVKGAALMTGTGFEVKPVNVPYKSRRPNQGLNRIYMDAVSELGMKPVFPLHPGRGSSDFGDFSHACPGIHPYFGIADREIAGHSVAFAEAAGSSYAMEQMLKAAAAMASTGYKFIKDKEFMLEVISGK